MANKATKAKAIELCTGLTDAADKARTVTNFVAQTMLYDHIKARTVKPRYRPNPDATLAARMGICWDFATLAAAMLRAVGVRCRVVIGYADAEYHAWNEALLGGAWVRYDVTATITGKRYVVYKTGRVR